VNKKRRKKKKKRQNRKGKLMNKPLIITETHKNAVKRLGNLSKHVECARDCCEV